LKCAPNVKILLVEMNEATRKKIAKHVIRLAKVNPPRQVKARGEGQ
jgi:hypothetical protein